MATVSIRMDDSTKTAFEGVPSSLAKLINHPLFAGFAPSTNLIVPPDVHPLSPLPSLALTCKVSGNNNDMSNIIEIKNLDIFFI